MLGKNVVPHSQDRILKKAVLSEHKQTYCLDISSKSWGESSCVLLQKLLRVRVFVASLLKCPQVSFRDCQPLVSP